MAHILLKTSAGRVGAVAGSAIIALGLWVGFGGSMGAAPRVPDAVTCFPTCDIDGRHLVVAGDDPTTLSAQAITIGLMYTPGEPVVNFEIFDANHLENWDTLLQCGAGCPDNNSPGPLLALTLYRDPVGDGTGVIPANVVATWTPGAVADGLLEQGAFGATNNTWAGDTVAHDAGAVGLDLNYHYALVLAPYSPSTNKGWNSFKIRAEGTVTLLSNQIVGFIGAYNPSFDTPVMYPSGFGDLTDTPYNGKWVFNTTLPSFLGGVTVFDGDMDFGNYECTYNDTDDPDSSGVPSFAGSVPSPEGVAVATGGLLCNGAGPGVRTGSPAEDGSTGGVFTRVPTTVPAGISYLLRAPDGQVFLNQNPSGNKEWEQFKIQKVNRAIDIPGGILCPVGGFAESPGFDPLDDDPTDFLYPASDCRTQSVPGGSWTVEVDGMDLANLNFWFFSFKFEPPVLDYSVGRLVWLDSNSNGVQDGGEPGIAGVGVTVHDGSALGPIVAIGVTDANGEFLITEDNLPAPGLAAGNYTVVVDAANFGAGQPLNGLTSTTGGEVQNGIEVGLPACTDTNVPVGCGLPVSAEALFGYDAPALEGPVFVIGDVEPHALGDNVNFWGAQWWRNNIMSGFVSPGASRASFKGFATKADLFCGGSWKSLPGNSPPPPATIPENVVIIVTSTIIKTGPNLKGDIKEILIVNQDGGYSPNPGHEGNGPVTSIICKTQ